jgi:MFS family permease
MSPPRLRPSALLPPPGPLRRYAFVTLVDSTGTGAFLTGSTLFFTRVLGLSVGQVGLGLSIAGLAALLGSVPLGTLGDRFGHKRVWVALTIAEALFFAAYPLVGSFAGFLVVVTLLALASVGGSPLRGAYLSRIAGPEQRVRARAYNQAVSNVGISLGALGAGVALQVDTRTAYIVLVLANAVSYLAVAAVLLSLPAGDPVPRRPETRLFPVFRDRPFLAVTVLNGLLMTYAAVLTVALPLWIVQRTHAPRWAVAGVFLLNTVIAVTLQVRASRGAETVRGAAVAARRAGLVLLVACAVFAVSGVPSSPAGALAVLAVAAVLFTLGEMLQSAGSWGLSYGLAPEDRQGQYLGAWSMGTRIYDAAGPLLVVGLVLGLGAVGWLVLGAFLATVAASMVPVSAWAQRRRPEASGGAPS